MNEALELNLKLHCLYIRNKKLRKKTTVSLVLTILSLASSLYISWLFLIPSSVFMIHWMLMDTEISNNNHEKELIQQDINKWLYYKNERD